MKGMIACLLAMSVAACSSTVRGADTRDVDTLSLAAPHLAGGGVGAGCGWADDPCRGDLICDDRTLQCAARDPGPEIGCTRNEQCPSSAPRCEQGICAPLGIEGDSCTTTSDCRPSYVCSGGAAGLCGSLSGTCATASDCPVNQLCIHDQCWAR